MTRGQQSVKRAMDLALALVLALMTLPVSLVLIVLASLDTGSFGLFKQPRVGRFGRLFTLFKIRTLKGEGHRNPLEMAKASSGFGQWLRRSKLDELPQFWQVVFGQMSLVGPRPDLPGYADQLQGKDRIILELRPGITGPASIKYRNEDQILIQQQDPDTYNDEVIWPDKVRINKTYYQNWSLGRDFGYLWQSIIHTKE